ncbi:MAG: DUF2381 family protein [Myxococcaceae bacterium]|nr:DUF2381 family protein [Myxococcaceae bacterium]
MSLPPAWIVWLLIPLAGLPAVAQPRVDATAPPVRQLEVSPSLNELEVWVAPGRPITLLFDAKLDPVAVAREGRALGFQRVAVAEDTLTLLPGAGLKEGARLRLEVRFADGQPPEGVLLVFIVDPTRAESLVEVYRGPRSGGTCQEALEAERARSAAKDAELARKDAEIAALRAEGGSLTALVAAGRLTEGGVRAIPLPMRGWKLPRDLRCSAARLYMARGRMALEMELKMVANSTQPWAPGEVTLTRNATPVPVLSARLVEGALLNKNDTARLVVEWEAPEALPDKPPSLYILEVMEQGGKRNMIALCVGRGKCRAGGEQ